MTAGINMWKVRASLLALTVATLAQTLFAEVPDSWPAIVERCKQSELSMQRIRAVKRACEEAGIPAGEAWGLVERALATPHGDVVLDKIQEGLAKGVPASMIQDAAQRRHEALAEAAKLAGESGTRQRDVVIAVMHAIESGVEKSLLAILLADREGLPPVEIGTAVHASEALKLGGFDKGEVRSIARDFVQRNLTKAQMRQAVAHANRRKASGTGAEAIRQELWYKPAGVLEIRTQKRLSRLYGNRHARADGEDGSGLGRERSARSGDEYAVVGIRGRDGRISLHPEYPFKADLENLSKMSKEERDALKAEKAAEKDAEKTAKEAEKEAEKAEKEAEKEDKDKDKDK